MVQVSTGKIKFPQLWSQFTS